MFRQCVPGQFKKDISLGGYRMRLMPQPSGFPKSRQCLILILQQADKKNPHPANFWSAYKFLAPRNRSIFRLVFLLCGPGFVRNRSFLYGFVQHFRQAVN